jgi:hypothetical protein
LILAQRQEAFEEVLRQREPDYDLLPREQRPVKESREALSEGLATTLQAISVITNTCKKSILLASGFENE